MTAQLTCYHQECEIHRRRTKQGIKSVEHAAMPWQDIAGIFNPEEPFKPGFCQIADGPKYHDNESQTYPLI